MIKLNHKVYNALIEMKFVERYEELSSKYDADKTLNKHRLLHIDGQEVMEMIAGLGYCPQFDAREKFYKISEEGIGNFEFGFHIILRDGMADFVWIVKENDELILGSPWGTYSRRLIDTNYRIKKPVFGTYDDLEVILKIAFEMYEDFKKCLVERR